MAALDNGIITASLTTLISSFKVSPNWGAWTITIYTLGLAISVPIVGKMSDRFGRKKLFLIEVALFGLGSLCVALSTTFPLFLAARFLQSMGGGGIFIIASSFILNTFPKEKQGRALGMLGGMNGIASILGPNIGSFILSITGSWHWLFLINLPIAIFLLFAGYKYINEEQVLTEGKLDWSGVLLLSTGIVSLMYSLTTLDGVNVLQSMANTKFLAFAGAGLILLITLYFVEKGVEKRGVDPILPTSLLSIATFRWTLLLAMLSGGILAAVIFIPAYIEQYLNVSSSVAGYWFTPLALASGVGAGSGGVLVDKKGPIFTLSFGSILAIIGFLLFPLWVTAIWQMVIASCLVGVGFGIMLGAPINVLATENTTGDKGIALATTSLARQTGMILGPNLYAGFLARSFMTFGDEAQKRLAEAHITVPPGMMGQMGNSTDVSAIREAFEKIPMPQVRDVLIQTLHDVVAKGYNGLFWSSVVISSIMLVGVLILGNVRKTQAKRKVTRIS